MSPNTNLMLSPVDQAKAATELRTALGTRMLENLGALAASDTEQRPVDQVAFTRRSGGVRILAATAELES